MTAVEEELKYICWQTGVSHQSHTSLQMWNSLVQELHAMMTSSLASAGFQGVGIPWCHGM